MMTPDRVKKSNRNDYAMWDFGQWPIDQRKGLRHGQAFLNYFYPEVVHPELFYTQTIEEAKRIINETYLTD